MRAAYPVSLPVAPRAQTPPVWVGSGHETRPSASVTVIGFKGRRNNNCGGRRRPGFEATCVDVFRQVDNVFVVVASLSALIWIVRMGERRGTVCELLSMDLPVEL